MVPLEPYFASDRRVYDGALCSDMKRERNHTVMLEKRMKEADPTAQCTYFPVEEQWLVFTRPNPEGAPRPLTDNFHEKKQLALIEAIQILEERNESHETQEVQKR